MTMLMTLLAVTVGGGLGSAARFLLVVGCGRLCGDQFPWGTLFVNVTGSLAMGVLVAAFATRWPVPPEVRLFLTTGILGGFTTFSAFSLDVALLIERGAVGLAAAYGAASVAISIIALFIGMAGMRWAVS